jgi:molecular chaperone GrpE (heat shock protein)
VAASREIVDRISTEVEDFAEFQKKMNDAEKATLRLEVEKLRRIEGDWLQVVVRILDHIFTLHTAATRSGQPELAAQIGHFQNACRDAARRVGLIPYVAEVDEAFDAERHRAHGMETPPPNAVTAETLAPGLTLQGRLIRPALVRLRDKENDSASPVKTPEVSEPADENDTTGQLL